MNALRFLLVYILVLCSNQSFAYFIKGKIEGVETGKVILSHTYLDINYTDTAVLKNGSFSFKGRAPEVLMYQLGVVGQKNQTVSFLLSNTSVNIYAKKDSLYKAIITGSPLHDLYSSFYKVDWKPITSKAGLIYAKLDKANQAAGKGKLDSITRKAIDAEFDALGLTNDSVIVAYVNRNKKSVAAAVIIEDRYINYPYFDKAKELYNVLAEDVKKSAFGRKIKAVLDLDAKLGINRTAPQFSQTDTLGSLVKLSDFKGKYVLVDFWASWCAPCRAENPNVVKVYNKYHDKGFEILGVSLDDNKESWLAAIHADELKWTHVSDLKGWANVIALDYGVKSVPANYLIDRDGKIIAKGLKGEALEKKLADILK